MISKLRALLGKESKPPAEPLRGRPKVRREKVYSADSGYVYQYFYEGFREAGREGASGHEYIFNCTSDRSARFTVSVFVASESLAGWRRESGQDLNHVEQYAVVKMTLFEAFDEHEHVDADLDIRLQAEHISKHAETLELFGD